MLTRANYDDLLGAGEGAGAEDDVAAAPRATPAPTKAVSAQKAWALKSVLKVFTVKADPNYGQPWQMCPQRSSSGSAFIIDVHQADAAPAPAAGDAMAGPGASASPSGTSSAAARTGDAPSGSTGSSMSATAPSRLLILTNSHVVTNATAIYVRRPGVARKFKAELVCDSKVCDLALLTVHDLSFWADDLRPLTFVDVPELQASISVAGHPVGGDSLCITKGIVSRLALVRYSPAARLLGIQIDAAINPGNSGGPAFASLEQGLVAGVAFSKNVASSTDNIGYVIPWRVVRHFVHDYVTHGEFRGVPSPGFVTQDLENPAQKAFFQMMPEASGVLVVSVDPLAPMAGVVKINDVLLQVDGEPVADDGTVTFRDDERLEYTHLVRSKHVGEVVQLAIWREGRRLDMSCGPLDIKDHLVPLVHGVDAWPSYFIVGGLVFTPLSIPFLEMVFGVGKRARRADIPVPILQACIADKQQRRQQVVVLVQVLAHEINHGYHKLTVMPCESFNGIKVHNLRHLAQLVDQALSSPSAPPFPAHSSPLTGATDPGTHTAGLATTGGPGPGAQVDAGGGAQGPPGAGVQVPPGASVQAAPALAGSGGGGDDMHSRFLNFGLEGGRLITLERRAVQEHGPGILAVHAIPSDRSEDLRRVDTLDAHWQQLPMPPPAEVTTSLEANPTTPAPTPSPAAHDSSSATAITTTLAGSNGVVTLKHIY